MRLRIASALAAVALLAATIVVTVSGARAYSLQATTGGCTGWGDTYIVSSSYSISDTDATSTGGCNWTYSQATFVYGGSGHIIGPGWVNSSFAKSETTQNVTHVAGTHNLCNAGGPCGSSLPWNTAN